ncbi:pyridoxamine 5'-phosphate oxidase family protein [Candidatus Saccharibacteria bacterium]|jgi:nitroimidazol reductase NimA-like FMN-containing flavoprotein (pyridoxamine 5'-phosphate oxidase superfamily)|nr:pyridoxamine 5'-phosphate oxidase family protein [Candidatus Saccharibacteria bacterium]
MNEVVRKILNSSRYATISTVDSDGNPWAAPVWYVRDENMNVYWWSPIESQIQRTLSLTQTSTSLYLTQQLPKAMD